MKGFKLYDPSIITFFGIERFFEDIEFEREDKSTRIVVFEEELVSLPSIVIDYDHLSNIIQDAIQDNDEELPTQNHEIAPENQT